ncbi:MAG: nucleoside diphosphate kinase regulator [Candidatus Omnitrophica bacterium]|nr:nucleoside diphosphate kinase regulator [Candidatus Omnitrophota bacterium]MDD4941135.1 nucleoside diphosphate kinase regulator [Candidatus Omnitrophota bacterium]MDD5774598.1 nucleoside diphosphate kinase regulator [Candidatus Omnitrophota bacterium]HNQ50406.1 nucleoside diphosphate kinase regulator [Candidatus Omnitrophota bacterium]HQO37698.1 nucleoside diphosphate kinase regulator [Candidatus Omnitrophota bacterium]
MKDKKIYIQRSDFEKLRLVLGDVAGNFDGDRLRELSDELDRAVVVDNGEMPPGIVSMNSRVCLKDMDTGKEEAYQLVYPDDADFEHNRISVLAPIGTAILGYQEGDVVEWQVPAGLRRLKIKKVVYEAAEGGGHGSQRVCMF